MLTISDIYTTKKGRKPLQKNPELYVDLPGAVGSDIISTVSTCKLLQMSLLTNPVADDITHARYRRILNHAFSLSALKAQESLIHSYCNLLISRLKAQISSPTIKGKVDIVSWLNFTTFDLIGDLTFGESFHALEGGKYHPWMAAIFENVRVLALMRTMRAYAPTRIFLNLMLNLPVVRKEINKMREFTELKTLKRLELETERKDLMRYVAYLSI
jgi:cytochrome P450